MKKILLCLLSVLVVLCICSCNQSQINEEMLNFIYEIDDSSCATEQLDFHHQNLIPATPLSSVNADIPMEKQIELPDKTVQLKYRETLFYPINEETLHQYTVNGNEDQTILLYPDGTISALLCEFATLDIANNDSPEAIRALLENCIGDLINISHYQHIDLPEQVDENQGFGVYTFLYYNMVEGYLTDFTRVSVTDEGIVLGLSINKLNAEHLELNIDKALEEELINLKLNDIYTTSETEYKSYNQKHPAQVVRYNGELFIQYSVSANYTHSSHGEMTSWLQRILIPVRLLTHES